MEKPKSEVEKFFEDLPNENKAPQDIFDEKPTEQVAPQEQKSEEDTPRKNRAYRRLEEKLQRERESNIAMAERIRMLSEQRQYESGEPTDIPADWIALYGDTPEARRAWAIQENMLKNYVSQAKQEAIEEIESRQQREVAEQKQYEQLIDNVLEDLEDEYGIDLTSNAPAARKARTEYLEMVSNLSPKDEDGTITGYADFHSTFELYQEKLQKQSSSRNKELAARSMHKSGQETNNAPQITPGFRGWQKDYNITN